MEHITPMTGLPFAWCFQALEDAFLAIDSSMTTEEVIKELVQIAGRPTEQPPVPKVSEEDDSEYTPNNEMCCNAWRVVRSPLQSTFMVERTGSIDIEQHETWSHYDHKNTKNSKWPEVLMLHVV